MRQAGNISVVTWNCLADAYASGTSVGKRGDSKDVIAWSRRSKDIFRVLEGENADIVCLQEVDHFKDDYKPFFAKNAYHPVYLGRSGREDGVLVAFKAAKFELVATEEVQFDDLAESSVCQRSKAIQHHLSKKNVALILLLRPKNRYIDIDCNPNFMFTMCSTHLYWNPMRPQIKLAQAKYLLARIANIRDKNGLVPHASVLAGDFNSKPQSQAYQCILSGVPLPLFCTSPREAAEEATSAVFQRSYKGVSVRFLCDKTSERLARWLRMLGVNAVVANPGGGKKEVTRDEYDALFQRARSENRIIVTQSPSMAVRVGCPEAFVIKSSDPMRAGLVKLLNFYNVSLRKSDILTLCGKCSGRIEQCDLKDPRVVGPVPSDRPLLVCIDCHQVYWTSDSKDASSKRARALAEELFSLVEEKRKNIFPDHQYTDEEEKVVTLRGRQSDNTNGNQVLRNEHTNITKQEDNVTPCQFLRSPFAEWLRYVSAFKAKTESEPDYTNINGSFRGTLDYIYLGGSCQIETVSLRDQIDSAARKQKRLFPNENWPSDHMLLRADIVLARSQTGRPSFARSLSSPSLMTED